VLAPADFPGWPNPFLSTSSSVFNALRRWSALLNSSSALANAGPVVLLVLPGGRDLLRELRGFTQQLVKLVLLAGNLRGGLRRRHEVFCLGYRVVGSGSPPKLLVQLVVQAVHGIAGGGDSLIARRSAVDRIRPDAEAELMVLNPAMARLRHSLPEAAQELAEQPGVSWAAFSRADT